MELQAPPVNEMLKNPCSSASDAEKWGLSNANASRRKKGLAIDHIHVRRTVTRYISSCAVFTSFERKTRGTQ